MWKHVAKCGKMWKNVENEEMEKYGMVIINEKRKLKSPSDSIRFLWLKYPFFQTWQLDFFAQFFL